MQVGENVVYPTITVCPVHEHGFLSEHPAGLRFGFGQVSVQIAQYILPHDRSSAVRDQIINACLRFLQVGAGFPEFCAFHAASEHVGFIRADMKIFRVLGKAFHQLRRHGLPQFLRSGRRRAILERMPVLAEIRIPFVLQKIIRMGETLQFRDNHDIQRTGIAAEFTHFLEGIGVLHPDAGGAAVIVFVLQLKQDGVDLEGSQNPHLLLQHLELRLKAFQVPVHHADRNGRMIPDFHALHG